MGKRLALLLCAITGISCGKARELRGAGKLQAPAALDTIQAAESADHIVYRLEDIISSFFWMGSNTPVRAVLTVAAGAPGARRTGLRDAALAAAGERCSGINEAGACIYEVNTHKEPSWLLSVEDPARRVAMAYRVFQKDASREKAEKVLQAALASYRPEANADQVFAEIRERPQRDEMAAALREEKMLAWFDRKGWPRPRLEETVRNGDCAYLWSRGFRPSLDIVCLAGSRAANDPLPPERRRLEGVTLAEYRQFNGQWQLVQPGQEMDITLMPWSAFQHDSFATGRTHYFLYCHRKFLYEGVGEEKDHEPAFLDGVMQARGQWRD